jgi:uncharacterized protein (DUF58 family)
MIRVRSLVIIGIAALLLGLATTRSIFFTIFYAAVIVLALSFFWSRTALDRVQLVRQTRARRAQVGSTITESFILRNRSSIPNMWVEVEDGSDLPGHHASHVVSNMPGHTEYSWTVRTICRERGRFRLGPLALTSGDPFGLFRIPYALSYTSNVVVYPSTVQLRSFPLPMGILPGGDALRRRTHYVTTNAASVRDYAPGDPFNRIHWKSTARKDRVIVKEFELDPLADVWIVLDLWSGVHYGDRHVAEIEVTDATKVLSRRESVHIAELPPSTEEYAITAAASIAQFFLRRDRTLGLIALGQKREIVPADRGERQFEKILETLAVMRARGNVPFEEVLLRETNGLPRGTTLVMISPSTAVRWAQVARQLSKSGMHVTSVVIEARSFGGPPGSEQVIGELAASNIPVSVVRMGDDLSEVLSSPAYGLAKASG